MRALRSASLVFVASLLTACGGDSTGPAQALGTYTLQTINGRTLPFIVVQLLDYKLEVTAGSITLNADQTFSHRTTVREDDAGQVTTEVFLIVGTFSQTGNTLLFTDAAEGEQYTGVLSGNSITISDPQVTLVYSK